MTAIRGVLDGTIFALIGISSLLIVRTSQSVNLALAHVGTAAVVSTSSLPLPWPWMFFTSAALSAAICWIFHFGVVSRLEPDEGIRITIASVGLLLVVTAFLVNNPAFLGPSVFTGGADGDDARLISAVCAFATVAGLTSLRRFRLGVRLEACWDDPETSALLGVPVHFYRGLTWAAAGALAGVAAWVAGPMFGSAGASSALSLFIRGLASAVLGKFRPIPTALFGLAIGASEAVLAPYLIQLRLPAVASSMTLGLSILACWLGWNSRFLDRQI